MPVDSDFPRDFYPSTIKNLLKIHCNELKSRKSLMELGMVASAPVLVLDKYF